MVAFRKLFPVLAVFALLLGASSAFAQGGFAPLQCTANSGVPPVVRAEGYTELVGDIVISCTGGNPAAPFFANFQLFLNTNITSRLIQTSSTSEALLMIDEPGLPRTLSDNTTAGSPTPFCVAGAGANSVGITSCNPQQATVGIVPTYQSGYNTVFYAQRVQEGTSARENALVWAGVPVVPPGSNRTRTFRITNVRANAAGLGASQTLIPTQIVAFVSVTPPGTLPIDNPQQVVGYVQQGLIFSVRNPGNSDSISIGIDQCTSAGANRDFRSDPLRSGELPAFGVFRFREGFQSAFKPQIINDDPNTPDNEAQNGANVGVAFNSESGFVRTASIGTAGVADSGTRLAVRFANLPANLRIFVSTRNLGQTPTQSAIFVSTDANGASNLGAPTPRGVSEPFSNSAFLTGATGGNVPLIEVPITSGSGVAVWEVVASNPSVNEDFLFAFGLGYTNAAGSTQVGLGTATVIGNLAPFYAAGTNAERMNTLLPIPRFVSRTETSDVIRVQACQTNLLFPYVTNWAGFDTGIAIANTSQDPYSDPQNRTQSGRCTLNYYGTLQNGQALTTTRETTNAEVTAGQTITMVLSTGGSLGLRGNPNMQGYVIAVCDFRFAHGFAFITDGPIGQARVAEGYLALVLDGGDSSTRLRGQSNGEVRGH